jgi:uncharacterized protein (DUF2141 family)
MGREAKGRPYDDEGEMNRLVIALLLATPVVATQGTARIAGLVVEPTSERPVRGSIVTLVAAEIPRGRAAVTDDEGRFAFERLPSGRFMLTASKPAYLTAAFGSNRPGRPGVPLQLATGQTLTNVRISMAHGAAITGTLRGPDGEPVANMRVTVFRTPPPGPAQTLAVADVATTDDRGVYRVYGLLPGTYVVATTPSRTATNRDIEVRPAADLDRAFQELQQRTVRASIVSPPPRAPAAAEAMPAGTYAFVPVFHPGVTPASAAGRITLAAGDERRGADITVASLKMATIQGTVVAPDGSAPPVQFAIRTDGLRLPSDDDSAPTFALQTGSSSHTFTYTSVSPGRYVIAVRTRSNEPWWARAEVEVGSSDVLGLSLLLRPAIRIAGRVVFAGASPRPDLTSAAVRIAPVNRAGGGASGRTQLGNIGVPPGPIGADGRFGLAGIIPDVYELTTTISPSSGWWLKSAMVNGVDVADHLLEIGAMATGDISGAVLTFSDQRTTLSGTLLRADGSIAPDYYVAVFPADRQLWRPESRRIRSARSGTDGRWIFEGLPPGEYLVAALTDLDADDLWDAAFLDAIIGASIKVPLGEGERRTQNLKLGGS